MVNFTLVESKFDIRDFLQSNWVKKDITQRQKCISLLNEYYAEKLHTPKANIRYDINGDNSINYDYNNPKYLTIGNIGNSLNIYGSVIQYYIMMSVNNAFATKDGKLYSYEDLDMNDVYIQKKYRNHIYRYFVINDIEEQFQSNYIDIRLTHSEVNYHIMHDFYTQITDKDEIIRSADEILMPLFIRYYGVLMQNRDQRERYGSYADNCKNINLNIYPEEVISGVHKPINVVINSSVVEEYDNLMHTYMQIQINKDISKIGDFKKALINVKAVDSEMPIVRL